MIPLFGRKLRMVVAGDDGKGIDLGRLASKFEVTRDYVGGIARAKITIVNLSPETTAKLAQQYTRIRLEAGYESRIGMIYDGEVRFAYPTKDGADRIVEIHSVAGAKSLDSSFVRAAPETGTDVRDVVSMIAAQMGLPIASLDIPSAPIIGARIMSGPGFLELDKLARDFRFRWMVDNGEIRIERIPAPSFGRSIVVSRETGMIDSPLLHHSGVEFTTLLDPRLRPGERVEVRSAAPRFTASDITFGTGQPFFPSLQGTRFAVMRLLHIGETRGQTWYSRVFAIPEGT